MSELKGQLLRNVCRVKSLNCRLFEIIRGREIDNPVVEYLPSMDQVLSLGIRGQIWPAVINRPLGWSGTHSKPSGMLMCKELTLLRMNRPHILSAYCAKHHSQYF